MQISKKTTLTVRSDCKDEGYYATHGWDNKYKEMHVPLTLYGPAFDATKDASVIGSVQNIELYKLLLNLIGIEEDSANLNTTVMPQQFSAFGKFAPLMLDPLHTPQSEQTEQFKPELPFGKNLHIVLCLVNIKLRCKRVWLHSNWYSYLEWEIESANLYDKETY